VAAHLLADPGQLRHRTHKRATPGDLFANAMGLPGARPVTEDDQAFLREAFFFFATLPAFFAAGFFALFVFVFFAAM
jgi:hypothetical protein